MTCGVAVAVLEVTVARLREALRASGVQARLFTSGSGDSWRFLDIVSIRAGKLEVRLPLFSRGSTRIVAGCAYFMRRFR